MPNWQCIEEAFARLVKIREVFDSAVATAIESRNSGALPVLEVLANEVDHLVRDVLTAFGPTSAIAGECTEGGGS